MRAALCAVLLFTLAACSPATSAPAQTLRRIVYGLTLPPSGFDPHVNASSELTIPLRQVYDTLLYRDPTTREFVAGLATAWQVSDDGLTYTFTLRQGVTFHDGTPFNAQAVGVNLDRITNPDLGSQKAIFMLGSYTGYEIVDDYTIRVRLAEPYAPLLDSFSQVYLGIASPIELAQYSADRYQFHQVGTGPFTFVDYLPNDHLTIRRNPNYTWGPTFYQPPPQNALEEIEFRFFEDAASRLPALENGSAQIMGELPPIDARAVAASTDVRVQPVTIPGQPLQFLLNTGRFPTNDVRVRQALLFAANREAIIDTVYQRFSPVAWSPLSSVTQFYERALNGAYGYDPARASTLLADAGLQDTDNNGTLDFGGTDVEVVVITPTWNFIPQVAQLLQESWQTIGIRARLVQVPSRPSLLEQVEGGEYNFVAWFDAGVDPAYLSRYFITGGANNWTGYGDSSLDTLLNDAGRAIDTGARQSLYSQAQTRVMEQALILPIREQVNLNGAVAAIEGLTYDAYGWAPLLPNVAYNPATE